MSLGFNHFLNVSSVVSSSFNPILIVIYYSNKQYLISTLGQVGTVSKLRIKYELAHSLCPQGGHSIMDESDIYINNHKNI